jgi:hypothetical protein
MPNRLLFEVLILSSRGIVGSWMYNLLRIVVSGLRCRAYILPQLWQKARRRLTLDDRCLQTKQLHAIDLNQVQFVGQALTAIREEVGNEVSRLPRLH